MTQDKLAEFYETEKQKGNPVPMNSILHFSLMNSAVKSGDRELMNHIQKGLQKYPNTLSRAIYNSGGKDEVIHNYGTQDSYILTGDLTGSDGWIEDIRDKNIFNLFLGTKNINKLNRVSNGINKTPMYLWRINSKPSEKLERVVRFGANEDELSLGAYGGPFNEYPALRVLQVD